MSKWRRFGGGARVGFFALLAIACMPSPVAYQEVPEDVDVLFIGNSLTYTNDLPGMLEALLTEGGHEATVGYVARPNYGLPDHWVQGDALRAIRSASPRIVVLQQGPSATEGRPYLLEFADVFAVEIREAGATPALYMVWPSSARSFDFDGVLDSYRTAAENVEGYFLPAGEAWRIAWDQDATLALYGPDGFHPSTLGTYLAALVIYEQIADADARDLPAWIPSGAGRVDLEPELAALLQAAAHEANRLHAITPVP